MRMIQQLRNDVAAGKLVIGTFLVELKARGVLTILKSKGFDFFVVDTEHGSYTVSEVVDLISAGRQHGICPIVRVSGPNHDEITHVLDAGAEGIIVPMARSLDYVREAVSQSKYAPLGRRGCNFMRPHNAFEPFADAEAAVEYMEQANRELVTAIQIETAEAAEQVDEIAAMEGVDMLYVGPRDLSASLGTGMQVNHPRVLEVCDKVVAACKKHGKIAAGHFGDPVRLPDAFKNGMNFLGYAAAIKIFQDGTTRYFEDIREALAAHDGHDKGRPGAQSP